MCNSTNTSAGHSGEWSKGNLAEMTRRIALTEASSELRSLLETSEEVAARHGGAASLGESNTHYVITVSIPK